MFRVRAEMTGGMTGPGLSTFYFSALSPYTAQDAADAVTTFWQDVQGRMSDQITVQVDPAVYTIDATTGQPTALTPVTSTPVVGFSSADPLPWSNQGLLSLHTGVFTAGREVRGRLFIPGADETNSTNGRPIAAYKAQLLLAAANLVADVTSEWIIYSRKHHTAATVNAVACWAEWASLRSRRD